MGRSSALMPKPILLAIDDDVSVLEAVVQDLRQRYGQTTASCVRPPVRRRSTSASQLHRAQGERSRFFLSDQRMPGMTGVELLEQAMRDVPRRQTRAADRLRRH